MQKQRHDFANKGLSGQGYGFSSGHVWMWELDREESWALKNWCFWTVVLEKTLESPLGCKEIQPVHPEGDQSWVFIGRTDAEVETPVLWSPHVKSWLIGKEPYAGSDWGQEEKGTTEEEASPTRWAWVWVNSGSWWWAGRPGMLRFVGSLRGGHNWTELNWSRAKANSSLPRELNGLNKHPLSTTQEMTLHMDINKWSILKLIDYILYSQRRRLSLQSAKTTRGTDYGSDHHLLTTKFWLKLKKVGEITRPVLYDLNQIPHLFRGSDK